MNLISHMNSTSNDNGHWTADIKDNHVPSTWN